MILSKSRIREELGKNIFISPFNELNLNSNSYNLTLSNRLVIYANETLDMAINNPLREIIIPNEGYILQPGELYLGSTVERTKTNKYIPIIEGRSSTARLGLFVHVTAGLGEAGFDGHWTLELSSVKPLRIYPYISVCQIYYNEISGTVDLCKSKKYQNSIFAEGSKLFEELNERNIE